MKILRNCESYICSLPNLLTGIALLCSFVSKGQSIIISTPNNGRDTLYASYYNTIGVICDSGDACCDNIRFQGTSIGALEREGCLYHILPGISFGNMVLNIVDANSNFIDRREVWVTDDIPLPDIVVNSTKTLHGQTIVGTDSLICIPKLRDTYNIRIKFNVVFFIAEIIRNDSVVFTEANYGNGFSASFKKIHKNSKVNDVILLRNIILSDGKNRFYEIPRKEIKIK